MMGKAHGWRQCIPKKKVPRMDEVLVKSGLAFWECFPTHPREFLPYKLRLEKRRNSLRAGGILHL
jgi:hypothetical protein